MHKQIGWASLAVFSLALAGAGAASAEGKDQPAKKTQTATTMGAACPTDDASKLKMVLGFLHSTNQSEIKHAKLAADRAQSPDVKQFADRMVREHTDADKKLTDLAAKKNIDLGPMQPADPVHAALMGIDSKKEQSLQSKKGASFDAAFMGAEPMEHDLALAVIEEGQKVAKDDEVKKLLNDLHGTLTQHKEHASNIIDKMKSGAAAIGGGPGDTGTKPEKSMKGDKGSMDKGSMEKSKPGKTPSGTGGGPSSGTKDGGSSSGESSGSSSEMNK